MAREDTSDNDNRQEEKAKKGRQLHEIGGETVTVTVYVNNIRKFSRSATIADESTDSTNDRLRRYTTDKKDVLFHRRSLGIKEIAKDLLS